MEYSSDPHIRECQEMDDADQKAFELWPIEEDMLQESLDEAEDLDAKFLYEER